MSYRQEIVGDTFYWHALYTRLRNDLYCVEWDVKL